MTVGSQEHSLCDPVFKNPFIYCSFSKELSANMVLKLLNKLHKKFVHKPTISTTLICQKEKCKCRQHRLLRSLQTGNNNKARRLLKKIKNSCDLVDSFGVTLLHYSVAYRNTEMVKYFVEAGCNVNVQNCDGYTPLMLAVQNHELTIVEVLLKNKADIYLTNHNRESSLDIACRCCITCIPPVTSKENSQAILEAFFEKLNKEFLTDKRRVTRLLLNANYRVKFATMVFGSIELIRLILNNGFAIDNRGPFPGYTALHCAIIFAKLDNAKVLIAHGANVNALDWYRNSPLYYYTDMSQNEDENSEVLKILLRHSNNLIERDTCGISKVEHLLRSGNKKTARIVLQSDICIARIEFSCGKSLLHVLVENNNDDVLDVLVELEFEFDVNARDSNRETALMTAARCGSLQKVEFLLKLGADVNMNSYAGESAVKGAVKCDKICYSKASKS